VMTGVGSVVNTARVAPGQSVAIFGMGGVGLAALLGAVAAGANPVIAVDLLQSKLELARSLGATHTVLADNDSVARIREQLGITQEQLAIRLQMAGWRVDRFLVSKIERGERQVLDSEVLLIANVLKVSIISLFGRDK